jgi:hypothetical protein
MAVADSAQHWKRPVNEYHPAVKKSAFQPLHPTKPSEDSRIRPSSALPMPQLGGHMTALLEPTTLQLFAGRAFEMEKCATFAESAQRAGKQQWQMEKSQ